MQTNSNPTEPISGDRLWNFGHTLASFIAGGLTGLADNAHGYPADTTAEQWTWELRHHAAKFSSYGTEEVDHEDVPYESLIWLAHRFGSLWD